MSAPAERKNEGASLALRVDNCLWHNEAMTGKSVEDKNPDEPIKRSEFEGTMISLADDLRVIRETMVTKEDAMGFAIKENPKGFATN